MKFSISKYSQVLHSVGPGYGGLEKFIFIDQYVRFPGELCDVASPMTSFTQIPVHQPCIWLMSDCDVLQNCGDLTARHVSLSSSASPRCHCIPNRTIVLPCLLLNGNKLQTWKSANSLAIACHLSPCSARICGKNIGRVIFYCDSSFPIVILLWPYSHIGWRHAEQYVHVPEMYDNHKAMITLVQVCRKAIIQSQSQSVCSAIRVGNAKTKHTFTCISRTNKTNSVALSPQVNYTDWATATCWRNLVPTFGDRGVSRGQRGGSPTVVNLSFLDRSRYFSFK
jgi:hypothetical protein